MKSLAAILASPALCLAVLGGIVVEKRTHTHPEDAAPFHARARAALQSWPVTIGDEWTSREKEVPAAAVRLLHPNAIVSRVYYSLKDDRKQASLLIVQCSRPNDMSGHYPPNCYKNAGDDLVASIPRIWQIGDVRITGMEYHFEEVSLGQPHRKCVYNFFVLPGHGIVPDMKDVDEATGDYQRRYYGAAEFQVLFPGDMLEETREEIFTTIIGSDLDVLRILNPPGI